MPTEIISGLWIGDINGSFDNNFLKDNNITILINCTLNYGFPDINVKKLRIPLSNNLTPSEDIILLKKNKLNYPLYSWYQLKHHLMIYKENRAY